jgi:hypothetical protein
MKSLFNRNFAVLLIQVVIFAIVGIILAQLGYGEHLPAMAVLPTLTNLLDTHAASAGKRYLGNLMLKASPLLQYLPFDDSVNPNPGKPLKYNYAYQKDMKVAAFRAFNADFNSGHVTTEEKDVSLKVFGDAFELDRVFAQADARDANVAGTQNWVELNTEEIARSIRQLMNDTAIRGDVAVSALQFDGLSKVLTGTTSELDAAASPTLVDLRHGLTDSAYRASLENLKKSINRVRAFGLTPFIFANEDSKLRLETIAQNLGYFRQQKGTFGEDIGDFAGAMILDLGVIGSTDGNGANVIPTITSDGSGGLVNGSNYSDLYVVGFGEKGFHAVTLRGDAGVNYYSNFDDNTPGVVRKVEGELVAAVVLKSSRAAFVHRDVRLS